MNGVELRKALEKRASIYGTLIMSTSPQWPDVVKNVGIDYVFIDTEHTPQDRAQVSWMCRSYNAMGLAPIVRIPEPSPYLATQVLDGGACGVMAPYVETVEEARKLIGAVKYKPLKGKQLEEALDGKPLQPKVKEYLDKVNAGNSLWINIESPEGIKNLPEMLKLGGIDAIIIGPHDLSISLGDPENYYTEKFEQACKEVFEVCAKYGVSCGCHYSSDIESHIRWRDYGLNITMFSSDIVGFSTYLTEKFQAVKKHFGEDEKLDVQEINI